MQYEIKALDNLLILDTTEDLFLVQGEEYADVFDIIIPRYSDSIDLESMSFTLKGNIGSYEVRQVLTKRIQADTIAFTWSPGPLWTSNHGMLRLTLIAVSSEGDDIEDETRVIAKWVTAEGIRINKDIQGENVPTPDVSQQLLAQVQDLISNVDVEGLTFDHNATTTGRDHSDAHPISAVTGLLDSLDRRPTTDTDGILDGNLVSFSNSGNKIVDSGFCCDDLVKTSDIRNFEDKSYIHIQSYASATWEIEHNLGKYPSVTVVDSAGSVVVGDLRYVNSNNIVIRFSGAFSGKAYFN